MAPTRLQLERAAADVISILKGISEYSNAKIAVIGGLALWKYLPSGRTTEVLDPYLHGGHAPGLHCP